MSCKVKICGITNKSDLAWVCRCRADYAGMLVDIPQSARNNPLQHAVELSRQATIPVVAVTMNSDPDTLIRIESEMQPYAIQLHGRESVSFVEKLRSRLKVRLWKVIHLPARQETRSFDRDLILREMERYRDAGVDAFLIDSMISVQGEVHLGGTGKTSDWHSAAAIGKHTELPVLLAGGIDPDNAMQAIKIVQPYALDVSSGVERVKGKKDADKVLSLITKVRRTNESGSVLV